MPHIRNQGEAESSRVKPGLQLEGVLVAAPAPLQSTDQLPLSKVPYPQPCLGRYIAEIGSRPLPMFPQ